MFEKLAAALTQPADGTVVGLVAQRVGARVAEAQVPAGQDEGVSQVRQTHHALVAVVAVLVIGRLGDGETDSVRPGSAAAAAEMMTRCRLRSNLCFLVVLILNAIDLLEQVAHTVHLHAHTHFTGCEQANTPE